MQWKTFKMSALSFTLSALCCIANVQGENTAPSSLADEYVMASHSDHDKDCDHKGRHRDKHSHRDIRPLRLNDFAGAFIFSIDSLGGIGAETPILHQPTVGTAQTFDGHITFDKKGNGVIDFGGGAIYGGSPGNVLAVDLAGTAITITITDPVLGVGSLHITNPTLIIPVDDMVDFVTVRSKDTGKVVRLEGHRSSFTSIESSIFSYTIERAHQ